MQRELDDRITRGAHRLGVLAADPDVVSLSPAATRKLVDALRDDRLYNNLLIADGTTGDVRASAVPLDQQGKRARPARVRAGPPHARLRDRGLSSRTGNRRTRSQPRATRRERRRQLTSVVWASLDLDWVSGFIERSGLPPSTVLTVLDDQGIVQYRSVDLEKYVGKPAGEWATALDSGTRALETLPASTASSACTLPSRWSFAGSRPAAASRSESRWLPIAPP